MAAPINVKIPNTVIGEGAVGGIADIVKNLTGGKILILTDAGIVKAGLLDAVTAPLQKAGLAFDIYDGCQEEPPIPLLKELSARVRDGSYEILIGVGGGSAMDTTKVISVTAYTGMPIDEYISKPFHEKIEGKIIPKVLVPTTAGTGAEWSIVTPVYDHEEGRVYAVHAHENSADRVIIDPDLTVSMPPRLTADTGMDALTHAIEAYTSCTANAFSDMLATTAIGIISESLRQAYAKGRQNPEARRNMTIAAAFAMNAVASSGIGLSHILNHHLGPKAHISHGTAVSLTLPAVMEFNLISNPAKFAAIAELMGENTEGLSTLEAAAKSVEAVRRLQKDLNLPQRLSDIGIKESDIPWLAKRCCELDQPLIDMVNPRDAAEEDIIWILLALL
jgi:alcohol dehydrogenase class IV